MLKKYFIKTMEKRNLLRNIPKKEPKQTEEKREERTLDESEIFKTKTNHDLDVVPVSVEPSEPIVEKVVETTKKPKKKKVFPKEICGCGKEVSLNMTHLHVKQKHHVNWLESQNKEKETEETPIKKDVESENEIVSAPLQTEEVVKEKTKQQVNKPFEIDYDRIINGVSQNYMNYKLQKKENKKPQVDDYKTKYEKLLKEQENEKKKSQAKMYMLHQNQTFGRRRNNGWFS